MNPLSILTIIQVVAVSARKTKLILNNRAIAPHTLTIIQVVAVCVRKTKLIQNN